MIDDWYTALSFWTLNADEQERIITGARAEGLEPWEWSEARYLRNTHELIMLEAPEKEQ